MSAILALGGAVSALTALGYWESISHRRRLKRIPIRIHVNGTRGKSSVTRLIAAALREAGITTVAKTTGTLPRMILPDGSELPVRRPSRANVIEQVHVVRAAAACAPQALVVECMALQPQLQTLCEDMLIRATHGVITNARADHLDVMGPTEKDVARALANMTPHHGKLFTAENKHLDVFQHAAADRGSSLIHVTSEDVDAVTQEDMAGFQHVEHAENVALTLRICQDLGIDRETALRGMWKCPADPGATTTHLVDFFGRRLVFVNAFAANDPDSTSRIWRQSLEQYLEAEQRIVIVNCRSDRPDRSWQLGQVCADWPTADHFVSIGTGTEVFARSAAKAGVDPARITSVDDRDVAELFETVVSLTGKTGLVVGIGNIGRSGLEIVRYFANRSVPEQKVVPASVARRIEDAFDEQTQADEPKRRLRRKLIATAASPNGNGNGNGHVHEGNGEK